MMNTIKLQAPEGVTSASFAGQQYDADADGVVEVPAEAALQLYGFGFGNVAAEAAPETPAPKGKRAPKSEAAPETPAAE